MSERTRERGRSAVAFAGLRCFDRAVAVLVGDFGTIGTVGLGAMLETQGLGLQTRAVESGDDLSYVTPGETQVVVLDRGMPDAEQTAARIAAEHPEVRVIVCSLDDTTMLVYPGSDAPPYEAPLDLPRLAAAIREDR